MPTAAELGAELDAERHRFKAWYDEHRNADGEFAGNAEDVKKFREWNADLAKRNEAYKDALDIEGMVDANEKEIKDLAKPRDTIAGGRERPGDKPGGEKPPQGKTLGQMFVESRQFKASRGLAAGQTGPVFEIDLDELYGHRMGFKTLFDTSTGYAPQAIRLPQIITPGEQQPTVASLMPEGRTSQASIAYMEETTTTNTAAEVAEGATKPEATLAFTEKTSAVRKIAESLPITDESLDDTPFIETYIDSRLSAFVRQREDLQLLKGDGVAPNLRGIQATSGILTTARGADASQDAIFKAGIQIQIQSFLVPTGVVLNPINWQTIRLMTTVDGIYLFGPPSQVGPQSLWGWDVVTTTAETANTGLVGAFRLGAEVFRRTDLSLSVGWVNDQFVKNQRTILVEERLALVVFRPKAFSTVTGLN